MNGVDPWGVLGLGPEATAAEIRKRYVELVKQHPPDGGAFERIRDADQAVRDPRELARRQILPPAPLADLEELIGILRAQARSPLGARGWLAALKEDGS